MASNEQPSVALLVVTAANEQVGPPLVGLACNETGEEKKHVVTEMCKR